MILDYDPKTTSFIKLHQSTFGKSEAQRIVPGQYLAIDPKGRSVMISAMDRVLKSGPVRSFCLFRKDQDQDRS